MNKNDYDKVLRKIELKNQNKIISFLQEIPFLKMWTRRMLLNFSYYLNVKQYPRGHVIFKEGEDCDSIAIVK
jgi:CRP-like cAMP-binding protein